MNRFVPATPAAGVPTLHRAGVTVRRHRPSDARGVSERVSDPVTLQWAEIPTGPELADCLAWIDRIIHAPRPDILLFAIEVEGRYAGDVGLRAEDTGCHIFYGTSPWARGRRVAGVAASLVSDWALTDGGGREVLWDTVDGNIASAKTAWLAGFDPAVRGLSRSRDRRPAAGWCSVKTRPGAGPVGPWSTFLTSESDQRSVGVVS